MTNVALNGLLKLFGFGRAVVTAAFERFIPFPFLKKPLRAPEKDDDGLAFPGFLESAALWPIPLHLKQRVLANSAFLEIIFPLPGTLFPLASRPRFGEPPFGRC